MNCLMFVLLFGSSIFVSYFLFCVFQFVISIEMSSSPLIPFLTLLSVLVNALEALFTFIIF